MSRPLIARREMSEFEACETPASHRLCGTAEPPLPRPLLLSEPMAGRRASARRLP